MPSPHCCILHACAPGNHPCIHDDDIPLVKGLARYYEHGDNRCCTYPTADFCAPMVEEAKTTIKKVGDDVFQLNVADHTWEAAQVT